MKLPHYPNLKQAIVTSYPKRRTLLVEFLLLVVLPVVISFRLPELIIIRHLILVGGAFYLFFLLRYFGFSLQNTGLTKINLGPSFRSIPLPTIFIFAICSWIIYQFPSYFSLSEVSLGPPVSVPARLVFYVFISVPLQEILFRSLLVGRLKIITASHAFINLTTSLIFASTHLIFSNYVIAVLSFFLSLWWTHHFLKYQNLWPIIFSHALLGSLIIAATF